MQDFTCLFVFFSAFSQLNVLYEVALYLLFLLFHWVTFSVSLYSPCRLLNVDLTLLGPRLQNVHIHRFDFRVCIC